MNVLIIGGTGVISTDLVSSCIKENIDVTCVNRGKSRQFELEKAKYLYCDASVENSVKKAIGEQFFDIVIDCISYDVNQLKKTLNSVKDSCKQFIFISTIAVFEPVYDLSEINENSPKTNKWDYGVNKVECEEYLREFCENIDMDYTIIRPAITFNINRVPFGLISKPNHWTLLKRIIENKPIIMWDKGEWIMTFTTSHDLSRALIKLFNNPKAMNEDFNIACGERISWNDVVLKYGDTLNKEIELIYIPSKTIEDEFEEIQDELTYNKGSNLLISQTKLYEAIGEFVCEKSFDKAIQETFNNFMSNEEKQVYNKNWDLKVDELIIKTIGVSEAKRIYKNYYSLQISIHSNKIDYLLRKTYGKLISKMKK